MLVQVAAPQKQVVAPLSLWEQGYQAGKRCQPRVSEDSDYALGYQAGLEKWLEERDRQIAKLPGGIGSPYETGAGDVRLRSADPWSDCDWLYSDDDF